ncbi:MAG TPA: penicillin-binding transpeptidase domain-containing protein [Symbiobacteriaceae bacterium]|nr:penicillin-binding transpeptidase domain-containing protein [Symbiobacteriaceae bacterium]
MVQKSRLQVLRALVVAALVLVASRLVWIQVVKADEIAGRTEETRVRKQDLIPVRGAILDRNLMHLAVSVPTYTVVAAPRDMKPDEEQKAAETIGNLLGLKPADLIAKMGEAPLSAYVPLKDKLNLEQKHAIEKANLLGIAMVQDSQRTYPNKSLANKIIGYMADGVGAAGLESRYEEVLAGQKGYVRAEFTYGNTPIESTIKEKKDPVPGQDLVLSIDMSLQRAAEAKLDQVIKEQDAKRAAILVMDIHTGELLVWAERPGADPGDRSTWGNPVDYGRIEPWTVRPLPPGSIFKTITTSAALEERAITLGTTFIDTGELRLRGCRIGNWDGYVTPNPAPMTIAQLLQRSSNVGLIQVGQRVGHDNFIKYLKGFGFLEKTGIDLPYEEAANTGGPFEEKIDCDWAGMFIGQHLEVTPLQMITAVSAIANGGKLLQPHVVREIREDGKVVWTAPVVARRQVITEQTAKEVRDLMVSVIRDGTANLAAPKGYIAGGKTGTAQKYDHGVELERHIADFIGFAPAGNPQVVMMVVVDEPKGQGFGGMIAAPVFGELMPQVMRAIGIAPNSDAAKGAEQAPPVTVQGIVPDVQWLPSAWAEARLAEAGFTPRLKGTGNKVATQSIQPGSPAKAGTVVELTLVQEAATSETVKVPDFTGLSLAEANRLATELGLTLKTGGSGFVVDQEPKKGTAVPARSTLSVRLAPRR